MTNLTMHLVNFYSELNLALELARHGSFRPALECTDLAHRALQRWADGHSSKVSEDELCDLADRISVVRVAILKLRTAA